MDALARRIMNMTQTEETLSDLFSIAVETEDMELNRWVRREASQIKTVKAFDLVRKTYILGGRYSFDDYMIACEWNREPQARFYLPRRAVLEGKHKIVSQIQEFMDDPETLYLGFSLPPGTGKTTLIKFLLSYIAGRDPQSMNMYCSYSDAMVKMMLDSEKAILTDTTEYCHNEIFPNNGTPDISAEYKTISYRRKGDFPTLGLASIGGSVTGRTRANKFLITDDLVKDGEMARSPERLEKLYYDYKDTLTTRMIGDDVKEIQLGTIWSIHDPISRKKAEHEGDPRYRFIAIPVKDENGHSNFYYDHQDRYSDERIAELEKSLDPVSFSCLYMQRGIEREGLALPADELQYYNGVLPDGEPDNVLFVCDVAWGGGDSTSMPILYKYGDAGFIDDVLFDTGAKDVTKPRVVGKILQHKCKMGRFEANNGGDEYADSISKMLKDEHGYSCNITHKKAPTTQGKAARIEQYAPDIKRYYFRDRSCRSPEYNRFMDEMTGFSFTSKNLHDDAADSMAMLADYDTRGVKSVSATHRPF